MLKEFKAFALKGNVVDMAVGVIIGVAFGKIVSSLVADVLMPPIGLLVGGMDFSNLFVDLSGKGYATLEAAQAAGAPTINYGLFLNATIDFVIVAFVIFMLIRVMSKALAAGRRAEVAAAPTTRDCPECLSSIPLAARRCSHCAQAVA